MTIESDHAEIRKHGRELRTYAATLTPLRRAELLLAVVEGIYDSVKLDNPEGYGPDGRDGPERNALSVVVGAAKEYRYSTYGRIVGRTESEDSASEEELS